jgi:hypothetical protein
MNLTYCFGGGTEEVTPEYPVDASGFSVLDGTAWLTVDGVGLVSIDVHSLVIGEYVAWISYSGETPGFIQLIITIEDCTDYIIENEFSYCVDSGTYEQQLNAVGAVGEYLLTAPITGITLSTSGLLTINTSLISISSFSVPFTIDGAEFSVSISIIDCPSPTVSELTDCELDPAGIVWVNQEGGRQSYWFNQPKEYQIDQSGGQTWINSDKEKRYLTRGRVEYGLLVQQNFIPIEHVTSINSLKNSIQAWICTNIGDASTYQSIILNEDTWIFKRTNDRFYSLSFEFKYSIAKTIQRQ